MSIYNMEIYEKDWKAYFISNISRLKMNYADT